jgi:hypothetical protein
MASELSLSETYSVVSSMANATKGSIRALFLPLKQRVNPSSILFLLGHGEGTKESGGLSILFVDSSMAKETKMCPSALSVDSSMAKETKSPSKVSLPLHRRRSSWSQQVDFN